MNIIASIIAIAAYSSLQHTIDEVKVESLLLKQK